MRTVSAQTRHPDPYRAGLALGEALAECAPEVVFLFSSIHYGQDADLLEGIQDAQLADWSDSQIEAIVKQHAENHYDAVLIDDDLMRVALTRDEFVAACDTHSAVNYITRKRNEARSEAALETVLTAAEACEVYGLAEATVRQAINRGTLPARKSAETWLVLRADCDARWGKK